MKKDELDIIFEKLEGTFDVHETPSGHQKRFLEKLNKKAETKRKSVSWWKPLSIAASFVLLIAVGMQVLAPQQQGVDLAKVSPQLKETQSFFLASIEAEVQQLKQMEDPRIKKMVDDALNQLKSLENDYKKMEADLVQSGYNKRVINAMITNLQNRMELLNQVTQQIEEVKTLKENQDENTFTL